MSDAFSVSRAAAEASRVGAAGEQGGRRHVSMRGRDMLGETRGGCWSEGGGRGDGGGEACVDCGGEAGEELKTSRGLSQAVCGLWGQCCVISFIQNHSYRNSDVKKAPLPLSLFPPFLSLHAGAYTQFTSRPAVLHRNMHTRVHFMV